MGTFLFNFLFPGCVNQSQQCLLVYTGLVSLVTAPAGIQFPLLPALPALGNHLSCRMSCSLRGFGQKNQPVWLWLPVPCPDPFPCPACAVLCGAHPGWVPPNPCLRGSLGAGSDPGSFGSTRMFCSPLFPLSSAPKAKGDLSGVFWGLCHDLAARAGGATSLAQPPTAAPAALSSVLVALKRKELTPPSPNPSGGRLTPAPGGFGLHSSLDR